MARQRDTSDIPSPILTFDQLNEMLFDGFALAGALGGSMGGPSGASGGAKGGKFGARHFTRLDGAKKVFSIPRSDAHQQTILNEFFGGAGSGTTHGQEGSEEPVLKMVGVVGSGSMNMNPCVVQIVWSGDELQAFAHAREGLIKQRTCTKALQRLSEVIGAVSQ